MAFAADESFISLLVFHVTSLCSILLTCLFSSSCLLLTPANDAVRGKESLWSNRKVLSTSYLTSKQPYIRLVLLNLLTDEETKALRL